MRLGYAANLWLRSAIRVQEQVLSASVRGDRQLYDAVASLDWNRWITPDQTLAISASVRDAPGLRHSGYVTMKAKDAVVDVVRDETGRRPSIDTKRPDLPLRLVLRGTRLLLYRDLSGQSLHKRGWRPIQVKSPLNEATAAGLLLLTDWDRASPVLDPMCGSGTFPIEAALLAADRAPGMRRRFAFERWPDFDAATWTTLKQEAADRAQTTLPFAIHGNDRHAGAVSLATKGAREAGVDRLVTFGTSEVGALAPPVQPKLVVTNPPYGDRLDDADLEASWLALGELLKRACGGATAWVLSGNPALTQHLRMRTSRRVPVMNGSIECRWLRYEVLPPRAASAR